MIDECEQKSKKMLLQSQVYLVEIVENKFSNIKKKYTYDKLSMQENNQNRYDQILYDKQIDKDGIYEIRLF